MLLGTDIGYDSTKDHKGGIITSAISKKPNSLATNKIIIDGVNYKLGYGAMTSEPDKVDSEINKVMTIYTMAKYKSRETLLALGLPVGQFETQKNRLRDATLEYNRCKVIYNEEDYKVNVRDVIVAPQGIAALYTLRDLYGDYIVVDIGGGTIDISLVSFSFNGVNIVTTETLFKGVRTIFPDILNVVNNTHNTKLTEPREAEKILKNGLFINGIAKDISILKPVLQEYVDDIAEDIKRRYPYLTTPIYLVGGGADLLYSSFVKNFPTVNKVPDPQFANAVGYYNLGRIKFAQRGYRVE